MPRDLLSEGPRDLLAETTQQEPKTRVERVLRGMKILGQEVLGAGETVGQLATGAVATPISGLAGIGATIIPGGRSGPEMVSAIQGALTYEPRTEAGQRDAAIVAKPFEWLEEKADRIGEVTGDPGDTLGATAVKTAILGAPALLGMARTRARPPTPRQQALATANQEGYVAPPASATTSGSVGIAEGMGGKLKTQQMASVRNQEVTNRLASRSLGLPDDTILSREVTAQVRNSARPVYESIRSSGRVDLDAAYLSAVERSVREYRNIQGELPRLGNNTILQIADDLKKNSLDASVMVDAVRQLRESASAAYNSGEAALGKSYRGMATALEDALEAHLSKMGNAELLSEFRNARELIAKSYTVENALRGNNVNAQLLAQQLDRGKFMSGELRTIGEFAQNFRKAAQTLTESVPAFSPLDAAYQVGSAAAALGTGNPAFVIPAGYSLLRPGIRNYLLSRHGQQLAQPSPNALSPSVPRAVISGASGDLREDDLR